MSDPHIGILRQVARQRQRDLDDHESVDHLGDPGSAARRQDLARTATRTRARVAAAQARRRYPGQTAGLTAARAGLLVDRKRSVLAATVKTPGMTTPALGPMTTGDPVRAP